MARLQFARKAKRFGSPFYTWHGRIGETRERWMPPAWSPSTAGKLDKGGAKELEAQWRQERDRMARQGGEDEAVLPA
jgi:hypothetical protein